KAAYLEFLQPAERLYLLDHYINYCQTHILHLMAQGEELVRDVASNHFLTPSQLEVTMEVMGHLQRQWELELAWGRSLREKEERQTDYQGRPASISNSKPKT